MMKVDLALDAENVIVETMRCFKISPKANFGMKKFDNAKSRLST